MWRRGWAGIALACACALQGCAGRPDALTIASTGGIGGHGFAEAGAAAPFGTIKLHDTANNVIDHSERVSIDGADTPLVGAHADRLDVLVISGGGSHGAYGAGVLVGMTEGGTRLDYDVVTGISTGALMASFAFLGPKYDAQLTDLYTQTSDKAIYESKGLFGLASDSLNDTTPLREKIAGIVTPQFLEEIAAEHAKGRRLYVGTTNLDTGELHVWDMGGIAASTHADKQRLYVEVLLASAAVPGLFKPVYIHAHDGKPPHMEVDGGVTAPELLAGFMIKGKQKHRAVHVIVNSHLRLKEGEHPVEPSVVKIAMKSISELMRGLTYKTIYHDYVLTRQSGADFAMTYIPDDAKAPEDALTFDKEDMTALFEVGRKNGRDEAHWAKEPPRLDALERIAGLAPRQPGASQPVKAFKP